MVRGSGNLFLASTYATILVESLCDVAMEGCDLLPAAGYGIRIQPSYQEHYTVDLRNNYWGTELQAEIEQLIYDETDEPIVNANVLYEPFEIRSVPAETESFGGLKSHYDRRN